MVMDHETVGGDSSPAAVELPSQIHTREQFESDAASWFAVSPEISAVLAPGGRILRVNPSWQRLLGWANEELVGKDVWSFVHPEELGALQEGLRQAASRLILGSIPRPVGRFRAKDGSYVPFELTAAVTSIGRIVVIGRDVTVQQRVETELRESEQRQSSLLAAIPDMMFRLRADGTYLDFKAEPGETFVDPSLIMGSTVQGLLPAPVAGRIMHAVGKAVAESALQTLRYALTKDGEERHFEARIVRSGADEVVCLVRNVSATSEQEAALAESEQRFRSVFESLHDVYYRTDVAGLVTMMSPSSERHTGYTPEDLTGKPASMVFVNLADYFELVTSLLRDESVNDLEVMLCRKDGEYVPTSINATLVKDAAGIVTGTQGTLRDISRRRTAEDEVRASEARYRRLMDTATEGIWMLDAAGYTTFANNALATMLATTLEDLMTRPSSDFMDPEWEGKLAETRVNRRAGKMQQNEFKYRKSDGSELWVWISLSPTFAADGTYDGVLIMVTDTTERRRAEEERDRIFTSSIDMIAVMTNKGRFIRINPAWENTLGYQPADLVGQSLWHFVHAEDRAEAITQTRVVSEGADVQDVRFRLVHKDGAFRWLSWNVGASTADGRCYAVVRDITEQVDAERRQGELMEALESQALALAQQADAMDRLRLEAEFIANEDALTGCLNRRAWFQWGTGGRPTAVAIYDIDHFKNVNDTYGHPIGDYVLKEVAGRLRSIFDGEATLGRIGGEEFAVLFHAPEEESIELARDAVAAIAAEPFVMPDGTVLAVTISAGFAPWVASKNSREESLALTYEAADRALYQAKEGGRHRLCIYDAAATARAA